MGQATVRAHTRRSYQVRAHSRRTDGQRIADVLARDLDRLYEERASQVSARGIVPNQTAVKTFLLDEFKRAVTDLREKQAKVDELKGKLKQAAAVIEETLAAEGILVQVTVPQAPGEATEQVLAEVEEGL